MSRAAAVHLPAASGKTSADENFPVASLLLSASVRHKVMAFYHFARTADDIADNPELDGEERLILLDNLEHALSGAPVAPGAESAARLRQAVAGEQRLLIHASRLLQAFRRDVVDDHCRDWMDLMAYCHYSASPVGRFLLDLHDEPPETHRPADALCAALQILNHLQDCADDYARLGRIYLPGDWMMAMGLDGDDLAETSCSPQLRQVMDHVLDSVDGLLDLAGPLLVHLQHPRLRLEAGIILALAQRLAALLRISDPLAEKVRLPSLSIAAATIRGLWLGLTRRS